MNTGEGPPAVTVHCISSAKLAHFLKREPRSITGTVDLDLNRIFRELLGRANEFLPSEAGTIYLDDPLSQGDDESRRFLVIIASFGAAAEKLVEQRLLASTGIIGEVYLTGLPYSSSDPHSDPLYRSGPGLRMGFAVESLACAPLQAEERTIGVIELVNHAGSEGYSAADLDLLGIFAQTISGSITNAIEAQRSKEIARHDELTELYNDRFLHNSLSQFLSEALAGDGECGVIFLDLDNFKSVNDEYGHLPGSRLLHEVGVTLRQIIPGNGLAARYGGDEFVIALPGAGRQETMWVAETVRKNIEDKVFLDSPDPENPREVPALHIAGRITCSVGVATLRSDVLSELGEGCCDPEAAKNALLRKADTCMYVAKERGRNRTVPYWELELPPGSG
ncbi:MAG: sensor domain-containing diguanylate cyclase [Acidobacteriota bacterium]